VPEAELVIVGKSPPAKVLQLGKNPGVVVAGEVPEIHPYLERASLLAVPLLAGGGTRLKILEAFAAGLPVVSTAVGAEGIEAVHGESIMIAEVDAMSDSIVQILRSPEFAHSIAANARSIANRLYDWRILGSKCVDITKSLVTALHA
jgi:glycosyltransferase involved in cell wall biosynthesis